VLREGRSALGVLHVAACGSGLELDHATVYSGGEKRDRGEDETRFHGSVAIFVADHLPHVRSRFYTLGLSNSGGHPIIGLVISGPAGTNMSAGQRQAINSPYYSTGVTVPSSSETRGVP
jgi:hypothetical protein